MKTKADYTVHFRVQNTDYGMITVPKGTEVTNQTALGEDPKYHFVNDFDWILPHEGTATPQHGLIEDMKNYGLNVPKEYIETPEEANDREEKELREELDYWSTIYQLTFQIWPHLKAVFISRGDVELRDFGGNDRKEIYQRTLGFLRAANPKAYRIYKGEEQPRPEEKPETEEEICDCSYSKEGLYTSEEREKGKCNVCGLKLAE
jgi:hypothetical protein